MVIVSLYTDTAKPVETSEQNENENALGESVSCQLGFPRNQVPRQLFIRLPPILRRQRVRNRLSCKLASDKRRDLQAERRGQSACTSADQMGFEGRRV